MSTNNTHTTAAVETAHTPTPWFAKHDSSLSDILAGSGRPDSTALIATVNHGWGNGPENAAFIVRACNAHAGLVEALNKLEASAVNLHCALQSTAHMDPSDKRIAVITGQVVKDLLVMRDQARAALAAAKE